MTVPSSAPETIAAFERAVRHLLVSAIAELGGELAASELNLSSVPDPTQGDVALPCFPLRGKLTALEPSARNNPMAIAQAVGARLAPGGVLADVRVAGPYVNLVYDTSTLASVVVGEAVARRDRFGGDQAATPERIVIEFSAPNTNKPQHLGHVRNNVLGEATARLLAHHGHDVVKVNLVNDRGIHICKSMLAYQRWGDETTPERAGKKGDHLIGDFYVLFEKRFREEFEAWLDTAEADQRYQRWLESDEGRRAAQAWEAYQAALLAEAATGSDSDGDGSARPKARDTVAIPGESDRTCEQPPETAGRSQTRSIKKVRRAPAPRDVFRGQIKDLYFNEASPLGAQARQMLLDWEADDPAVRSLWRTLNGWVLAGFDKTYARLGVSFGRVYYESETYALGKGVIDEGLSAGIFRRRDDGAIVYDLAAIGLEGEKVFLRSDGTSVYITQDLGTAAARHAELGFERMIYVVADEQAYHFKILFAALAELRPELRGRMEHLAYGLVQLPSGRMKSREGTVVDADELMDEMARLARAKIDDELGGEHYAQLSPEEVAHRAERIGLAALKYYLLDVTPPSTMEFDPAKSIDLQGRTGAYCLYNYARTRSLLRKAGGTAPDWDADCMRRLRTPEERRVLLELMRWPDAVRWAAETRDPSKVAEYLFDLCKTFAFIFTDRQGHPIVTCEDAALRRARLLLVDAVGTVLRVGLGLLGIETLEEM